MQDLIEGEIDRVNAKFARVEQIKKFFLLETQLTAEDEELTPTMKLKRKLVHEKYARAIEAMYAGKRPKRVYARRTAVKSPMTTRRLCV